MSSSSHQAIEYQTSHAAGRRLSVRQTRLRYASAAAGLVWLSAASSLQADQAVLIGGGYDIQGSQGQIELNVKWVQGVLQQKGVPVTTYFTDGDANGHDVHYQTAGDEQADTDSMEALSRVFGDWILEQRRYRNHTVENVSGSTQRDLLEPALQSLIQDTSDEPLLLVYNGHGSQSYSTPDQVTLDLWNNTAMTADELHAIAGNRNAPLRFVFTQCYSGGFHRLAYQDPAQGLTLSREQRCGFTAESAYRLAEGCSASIDTDDYRDYTTYFFSALSGFERNGEIIDRNPDTNNDGITTLREAHLFTLETAFSTDLSRSTSEDFLDNWQPWYLRWLPSTNNLPNNEYARIFREIAASKNIVLDANVGKSLQTRAQAQIQQRQTVLDQRSTIRRKLEPLQYQLQDATANQWPQLFGPYTAAFAELAASGELLRASQWLNAQANYQQLRNLQQQDEKLDATLLTIEREITQLQKLGHLRRLAVLQQQLEQYGSNDDQASYRRLLECEESPLHGNQ